MYSGVVAASAYRRLELQKPRRIVLLGFSHSHPVTGINIPDVSAYRTPLGEVAVDAETIEQLAARTAFRRAREETLCDHSIEIQLPFLQIALPRVQVVPLYVGDLSASEREGVAAALAELAASGTVLVASSDLTHYGHMFHYLPFPVDERTPARLRALDRGLIHAAASLDPVTFLAEVGRTRATVCGTGPISLLLETLRRKGRYKQETLDYQTSGEITGDWRHSVSYAALGYWPAEPDQPRRPASTPRM
jgi:hypothetical protein